MAANISDNSYLFGQGNLLRNCGTRQRILKTNNGKGVKRSPLLQLHRGYYIPARGYEFYPGYLWSECSERVRYGVEHEKMKFIYTSGLVIFYLLY